MAEAMASQGEMKRTLTLTGVTVNARTSGADAPRSFDGR
jgi:hypothetical protein